MNTQPPRLDSSVSQFLASVKAKNGYTVLAGPNNSGKSYVLKHLYRTLGNTAYLISTNRFYHTYFLGQASAERNDLENARHQLFQHIDDPKHNHESNHLSFDRVFTLLNDDQRTALLTHCHKLLGFQFSIEPEIPNNRFSRQMLLVDGIPLSVTSTGVRLLILLLACCYFPQFEYLIIDEPELSLSPPLQSVLKSSFADSNLRRSDFPHLKHVVVATHSHIFLDRNDYGSNVAVTRVGNTISANRLSTIHEFLDLQFNLLGNQLEFMFLPSAIVLVEGPSDRDFISHSIRMAFSGKQVAVINAVGDGGINAKLRVLSEAFGDLRASPYHNRVLAVVDSRVSVRLDRLRAQGIPDAHLIQWKQNGIEHYYPPAIMAEVFKCTPEQLTHLSISDNEVSMSGHTYSKTELARIVCSRLSPGVQHHSDFQVQLLDTIANVIGRQGQLQTAAPADLQSPGRLIG